MLTCYSTAYIKHILLAWPEYGTPTVFNNRFFLLLLDQLQLLIVYLLFKNAFEILEILRWSYICCVVVWVFASLTIFCGLYLLAVWILSCCDLMIIFGILCHRFVTSPFLISPGFRLPCLVPLVAWDYVGLIVPLQLPF